MLMKIVDRVTSLCRRLRGQPYILGRVSITAFAMVLFSARVGAVDYHVKTAQDLQTALTLAAASSTSNNIYITNGYYAGNFNFNAVTTNSLNILAETNLAAPQITVDGGGTGRDLNIANQGIGNITVSGITFLRNCGSATVGALRVAAGLSATILIENCQFITTTNGSGMGIELTSGLNATITNCSLTGLGSQWANNGGGYPSISISGVTGTVDVNNCAITKNWYGLNIQGANQAILTGNLFQENFNNNGGAALNTSASVTEIDGNLFIGNSAYWEGGAISQNSGIITVSSNTFIGNSVYYGSLGGGAIYCASSATIVGNTFTGNYTDYNQCCGAGNGGAVNCASSATIIGNTFSSNSCGLGKSGGAVYCSGGSIYTVSSNTFLSNVASASGGGLYIAGSLITIRDNLFANNSQAGVGSQGGGVWVNASSSLNMINNTVSGNNAIGSGGGVAFQVNGVVELLNVYNNIIWGNSAGSYGGDVWLSGTGQAKVFSNNDVDSMYGVWDLTLSNVDLDPKFFDPINGDYHTMASSPCVNAGTTNAPMLPVTDLDGNPRIINGLVDMGCYEFTMTVPHPADTNGDFFISSDEFNAYASAWKNGQLWSTGTNSGPIPISANYLTRAGYLMTNGGAYHNDGSARPVNWKIGR